MSSKGFNTSWNWKEPFYSSYKPKKKKKKASAKQKRAEERRKKRKDEMEQARNDLKNHFSLQKYPTNMAICLCIHKEHGLDMPENDRQASRMVVSYWKRLNGQFNSRRRRLSDDDFYASQKWKEVRYIVLQQAQGKCCLCGAMAKDGVQLHVDHIRPRSLFPEQEYDLNNLQVLCSDCNIGKSNYDDTDWLEHWKSI